MQYVVCSNNLSISFMFLTISPNKHKKLWNTDKTYEIGCEALKVQFNYAPCNEVAEGIMFLTGSSVSQSCFS